MSSFVSIAISVPLALFGAGCMDSHSIHSPRRPDPETKIDVGPIVDQNGVDVGPVVAARLRERKLGDAHYVSKPGENPYFSGTIQLKEGDAGFAASNWGGWTLMTSGGIATLIGGIFVGISSGQPAGKDSGLGAIGTPILALGIVGLASGIALLVTQPSRYRDATITTHLDVKRDGGTSAIDAKDVTTVRHDAQEDDVAGGPLLDGVANAISNETKK